MSNHRLLIPLLLGAIAVVGNYVVLSRASAKIQLVAVRCDLKPGQTIEPEMLIPVNVNADAILFTEAHRYSSAPALVGKTVKRPVKAGGMLFVQDMNDTSSIQTNLIPPGYMTLVLPARKSAIAANPSPGESVIVRVRPSSTSSESNTAPTGQYGPFLFLGWYEPTASGGRAPEWVNIAIAIPINADARLDLLRQLEGSGDPDRLASVNIIRGERTEVANGK